MTQSGFKKIRPSAAAIVMLLCNANALVVAAEQKFHVNLDSVQIGYPGAEYWGLLEGPDGRQSWSFAIYEEPGNWSIPVVGEKAGKYRLVRVEKRQGEQREDVYLAPDSKIEMAVADPVAPPVADKQTLVAAGEFTPFFAAAEPWCVNDHTLIQGPDKTWHLFGITHPKPLDFFKDPGRSLAHATGQTLLDKSWQALPPAVTADWDKYKEYLLWAPHVIRNDGTYYMYVCVGDKDSHNYPIHLLTSEDLQTWTRSPDNPVVVDGFDGRDPMVLQIGDEWVLYYTATSVATGGNRTVNCVTSKDLIHWNNRQIVFVHPQVGSFGGPTESPFVVRRGGNYYLFVCDNDWINVFLSHDPFRWEYGNQVGRIQAHACEVLRDADGKWYMTHAGWMNGPVEIAPLNWHDGLDNAPASVRPAE